jgi:hypothetical protein
VPPTVTTPADTRPVLPLAPLMAAAISRTLSTPSLSESALASRSTVKLAVFVPAPSSARLIVNWPPSAAPSVRLLYDTWLLVATCSTNRL